MHGENSKKNNGLFDMWVASCCGQGKELYLLEEGNGVKLFKLQTYFCTVRDRWPETPTYHVWVGNTWECATTNYMEAFHIYLNARKAKKEEVEGIYRDAENKPD